MKKEWMKIEFPKRIFYMNLGKTRLRSKSKKDGKMR